MSLNKYSCLSWLVIACLIVTYIAMSETKLIHPKATQHAVIITKDALMTSYDHHGRQKIKAHANKLMQKGKKITAESIDGTYLHHSPYRINAKTITKDNTGKWTFLEAIVTSDSNDSCPFELKSKKLTYLIQQKCLYTSDPVTLKYDSMEAQMDGARLMVDTEQLFLGSNIMISGNTNNQCYAQH